MKATVSQSAIMRGTLVGALLGSVFVMGAWGQKVTPPKESAGSSSSKTPAKKPDFPPFKKVIDGYEKVVSTMDGKASLYTIYVNKKQNQMLAVLPRGYAKQKHFIALTVAGGEMYAGLQVGDMYVYWKRYGKRLALIKPNIRVRSTGDPESKSSVKRLFTGRVVLDVPILALAPARRE